MSHLKVFLLSRICPISSRVAFLHRDEERKEKKIETWKFLPLVKRRRLNGKFNGKLYGFPRRVISCDSNRRTSIA